MSSDVVETIDIKNIDGKTTSLIDSIPTLKMTAERERLFFGREYVARANLHCASADFLPDILQGFYDDRSWSR